MARRVAGTPLPEAAPGSEESAARITQAPDDILTQNARAAAEFVTQGAPPVVTVDEEWVEEREEARRRIEERKQELLAAEAERRKLIRAELAKPKGERRLKTITARTRTADPDATVITDKDGTPAGTPGYHRRWVRLVGPDGVRANSARAGQFTHHGYRPILGQDGRPITGPFGMAMECPPEAEAARRFHYEKELVPIERYEQDTMAASVEEANREAGYQVGTVVRHPEHRRRVITQEPTDLSGQ